MGLLSVIMELIILVKLAQTTSRTFKICSSHCSSRRINLCEIKAAPSEAKISMEVQATFAAILIFETGKTEDFVKWPG